MIELFAILIVVGITFTVRAAARIGKPIPIGSDPYANLVFTREIRRLGHRIPDRLPTILTSGPFCYPPLLHIIVSFFPEDIVERYIEPYWGAGIDSLQALLIYFFSRYIFQMHLPLDKSIFGAFLAAFIFSVSPILVRIIAGQFFISARPLGNLLFTCASFFTLRFYWSGELIWLLPTTLLLTLAVMSSKFTVQNIFFISIGVWIVGGSVELLLAFFTSQIIAIIITGGKQLRVLRHHLGHMWLYATRLQFMHGMVIGRKSISDRVYLVLRGRFQEAMPRPSRSSHPLVINPFAWTYRLISETPELTGISHLPLVIPVLWVAAITPISEMRIEYRTIVAWILIGASLTLITSFRYFRFLGEPERYLGYVVFPVALLTSFHTFRGELPVAVLIIAIIVSLLIIFYAIFTYRRSNQRRYKGDAAILIGEQLDLLESKRVICIPTILAKELMYRSTNHRYLCFAGANLGSTKETVEEFDFIFSDSYPRPRRDLRSLVDRFQCNALIIDNEYPGASEYEIDDWTLIYQNEKFNLYIINGSEL